MAEALERILSEHKVSAFRIPMQDLVSATRALVCRLHQQPSLFDSGLTANAVEAFKDGGLTRTLLSYARYQRR
ncbi:hypothetical protein ACFS07_20095 [Undibacterium arcticum]